MAIVKAGKFTQGREPLNSAKPSIGAALKRGAEINAPEEQKPGGGFNIGGLLTGIGGAIGIRHVLGGAGSAPPVPVLKEAIRNGVSTTPATSGLLASGGPALTAGGIVGGGVTGALQAKGAVDLAKGKAPNLASAATLLPFDGGASLAVSAADKLGFGHSKDYRDGKTRATIFDVLTQGGGKDGELVYETANGPVSVTSDAFKHDQSTYNYDQSSPSMTKDIGAGQALAYLKTKQKPGEKQFNDVAGMYANLKQKGADVNELYGDQGYDYATAYAEIRDSDLDQPTKDALLNGLDESFGANAYAQPATGSGGGGKSSGSGSSKKPKAETAPVAPPVAQISDVIPVSTKPATMPEPDDEAGAEEQDAVNSYQNVLDDMLKRAKPR